MSVLDTFPNKWSGMQREWEMVAEMIGTIPDPTDLYFFTDGVGLNAGIGKGTVAPTAAGENSLAQGDASTAGGTNAFAQGYTVLAGGDNSFAQGAGAQAGGDNSFAQGYAILANSNYVLAQGKSSGSLYATHVLAQGESNLSRAPYTMIQGHLNTNYSTERALIQGDLLATGYYGYPTYDMIVQGSLMYAYASYGIAQGTGNTLGVYPYQVSNSSAIGSDNDVYSSGCFAQGASNTVVNGAEWSFAQGENNTCSDARGFAQGYFAHSYRADQKTFGSNRTTGLGHAQSSQIIKWAQTTNATEASILDMLLEEGKAYSLHIVVVVRNQVANDEVASFLLEQALAYRDAAGAAQLIECGIDPTFPNEFTKCNSDNGDEDTWDCIIDVNGNNFRVRIIGDANDTLQWCCNVRFVEVFADLV